MGRQSLAFVAVGLTLAGGAALFLIFGSESAQDGAHEPAAAHDTTPNGREGPVLQGLSEEAVRAQRARAAQRWQEGIASEDGAVRLATVKAWEKSGKELGELAADLLPLLADWKPYVREAAREAFLGLGASGVSVLVRDGLSSSDVEVPALAIEMLGMMAEKGAVKEAVGAMLEILGNPARSRALRERAATSLGRGRPVEESVRAALGRAALDPNYELAASAVEGIGLLEAGGEPHIPLLLAVLADRERWELHAEALRALSAIRRQPEVVIPALFALARERHQSAAAHPIAAYGRASLPFVREALTSGDPGREDLAIAVLKALGPGEGSLALASDVVTAMRNDGTDSWNACSVLESMGPAADAVVPALAARLDAGWESVDGTAICMALAALGPKGRAVLRGLLGARDPDVRFTAIQAFDWKGRDSDEELLKRLEAIAAGDAEEYLRGYAKSALSRLAPR